MGRREEKTLTPTLSRSTGRGESEKSSDAGLSPEGVKTKASPPAVSLDFALELLDKLAAVELGSFNTSRRSDMPVKYGVIGCGAIAQRRHIPECIANPDSVLIGIAEFNQIRCDELGKKYGVKSFCDHKDLLKMGEIDAIVVSGPNALSCFAEH